jgi:putative ABC transport system permease protein
VSLKPPPRLAERLLEAVLTTDERADEILGDLHEEHAARALGSRWSAAVWYWSHTLRLGAREALERLCRPSGRSSVPAPVPSPNPGDSLMRTLGLEMRHAARSIRKRPALSGTIVVTLALGLGANAAIFSTIDALVLRPFTMPDVDRVAMLSYTRADDPDRRNAVSPADFLDLRKQTDAFERFAAFQWWNANLVGRDEPENVQGFFVSADFFPALGIEPAVGRNFLAGEETQGHHQRVILGHALWERRFSADRSIVGRSIEIDARQYEVVGIAPEGFDFPMGAQLWAPLSFTIENAADRRAQYLTGIGRLAPGRTLQDAKAQMAVAGERLARDHPETNRDREGRAYTLGEGMMDLGIGPILSMWQASAGFVLLIACANVASLLLARGAERQREMAVRLAIGASRARVMRELLIESVMLSLVAVPAALGIAWISLKLMVAYMPPKIARFVAGWYELDVDLRLVTFTAVLAVGTAVLFGLIPAVQASRPRLSEALKEGGRSSTSGVARLRLRRGLVIGEMALALPLLVASGLSVLTVHRFLYGPQGFNPDGVLTMQLVLPAARYADDASRLRFVNTAVEKLHEIPGIEAAAAANVFPSTTNNWTRAIEIEGKPPRDPQNPPSVDYRATTPAFFAAFGIPIVQGRPFTEHDDETALPVAIVSASLARRYWPGEDALGKRIKVRAGPWLRVVGVSGDVIHDWFNRRNHPTLYRPFRQAPTASMALMVRTSRVPTTVAAEARTAIRAVDAAQPVFDVMSLRASLQERTLGLQYVGAIMFVFGGLALMLAVVGVYGVMANMVTQRAHEIGVRMALGATHRDVVRLTIGQTGALTAIGVGLGIGLSLALGRLIEAGLVGVAASDGRLVAGVAAVLVLAALSAGYIPARRAASIDPCVALRTE